MSLFGSMMGDFEDDPFFGSHMRQMNQMMNSMLGPFGMMGPSMGMGAPMLPLMGAGCHSGQQASTQMVPFGFPQMPMMNQMFSSFNNMGGNCTSYSSSSVISMTSSPDGKPQIYQESMSTRMAPGGIKETKKTVSDSRSGVKKMAIGHHIGERAHILEREQNYRSGDQEERQEFINLEEEEADEFNQEWETKTRHAMSAIAPPNYRLNNYGRNHHHHHHTGEMLALPSTVPSSHQTATPNNVQRHKNRNESLPHSPKPNPEKLRSVAESTSTSTSSTSDSVVVPNARTSQTSPSSSVSRKREHTPDSESSSKRKMTEIVDLVEPEINNEVTEVVDLVDKNDD